MHRARSATARVVLTGLIIPLPILSALLLTACGEAFTSPFANEGRLLSISVSGPSVVQVGDTIRLSTWGKVDGLIGIFTYDRVLDARWTVSDPSIASIAPVQLPPGDTTSTSAVIVRGLRTGSVQVSAAARGVTGSATVNVGSAPAP